MMLLFKFFCGLLLLPLLAVTVVAFFKALRYTAENDIFWVPFAAGAACFCVVLTWLPKPIWIYVIGHEVTHALWTLAFGGKVKKIRASREGGHVIVTRSNFLISLSPYFFPLYSAVILFSYGILKNWIESGLLNSIFFSLLGFTLTFHVVMNAEILKVRQPDWAGHGYFFSGVVVLLGNSILLGIGLSLLNGIHGLRIYLTSIASESNRLMHLILK